MTADALTVPAVPVTGSLDTADDDNRGQKSVFGWMLYVAREIVAMLAIVFALPVAILCIGVPIALAVRLVLWIVHLL